MPEIQASFLYLFSYAPLGEGGHITGERFFAIFGVCLSPTPSRQPLFETSDKNIGVAPSPPPVPGGVAPNFGSEKVSRYTGGSQLQLRVSRYTVQLSYAASLVESVLIVLQTWQRQAV